MAGNKLPPRAEAICEKLGHQKLTYGEWQEYSLVKNSRAADTNEEPKGPDGSVQRTLNDSIQVQTRRLTPRAAQLFNTGRYKAQLYLHRSASDYLA